MVTEMIIDETSEVSQDTIDKLKPTTDGNITEHKCRFSYSNFFKKEK